MDSLRDKGLFESVAQLFHEQKHILLLMILVTSLGFVSASFFIFSAQQQSKKAVIVDSFNNQEHALQKIMVDVSGAVKSPGIYALPQGSRVSDALQKAQGILQKANNLYIQKNINLAAPLTDGQKIYIPYLGESGSDSNVLSASSDHGESLALNTASEKELDALPGIGAVTVAKIIKARPFSRIEELVEKKVVTKKVFESIKDKIRAN